MCNSNWWNLFLKTLKPVPPNWSKLKNVANNEVFKKTVHDRLIEKVNKVDASGFR